MKKLSKINESLWMDSIKRANSNTLRKEDNFINVDDVMEYFDNDYTKPKITIRIENGHQVVDVEGDFVFIDEPIKNQKLPFKFGNVTGDFSCNNTEIDTLEGCPDYVGGDFYCMNNNIKSLEGCPKEVGGDFCCKDNKNLTSLKGIGIVNGTVYSDIKESKTNESLWMDSIKRANSNTERKEDIKKYELDVIDFLQKAMELDPMKFYTIIDSYTINPDKSVDIVGNVNILKEQLVNGELPFKFGKITKLTGEPKNMFYELSTIDIANIHGDFNIRNIDLKTLKNSPDYVEGRFECGLNEKLETLEGGPKYVGAFVGDNCTNLKSFKGCPEEINTMFWMQNSTLNIEDIKYFPKKIEDDINLQIRKHDLKHLGITNDTKLEPKFTKEYIKSICDCNEDKINIKIIY